MLYFLPLLIAPVSAFTSSFLSAQAACRCTILQQGKLLPPPGPGCRCASASTTSQPARFQFLTSLTYQPRARCRAQRQSRLTRRAGYYAAAILRAAFSMAAADGYSSISRQVYFRHFLYKERRTFRKQFRGDGTAYAKHAADADACFLLSLLFASRHHATFLFHEPGDVTAPQLFRFLAGDSITAASASPALLPDGARRLHAGLLADAR